MKDALVDRESTLVAIQSIYEYMYQLAKEEASKRDDTSEEEILEIVEVTSFFNMSNRIAAGTDMRPNAEYHNMGRE